MPVFRDARDMREFLSRFRNYLALERCVDASRRPYVKLHDKVSLLSYCLMRNHFHFVIHQQEPDGMSQLMRRGMIAYGRYFNLRHDRCGPVFRSRYAAKPIETIEHAKSTLAYVHLNEPISQLDYEFSSHALYMGDHTFDWIDTERGLAVFGGIDGYASYLNREGPRIVAHKLEELGKARDSHAYRPLSARTR